MKKNIENYLFHKNKFLDREYCNEVIKNLELSKWDKHNFAAYEFNSEVRFSPSGEYEPDFLVHDSGGLTTTDYPAQINNFIIKELKNISI